MSASRPPGRFFQTKRIVTLDTASRNRRLRRYLEKLESDNHHSDPNADVPLVSDKRKAGFMKSLEESPEKENKPTKKQRPAKYYQEKYGQPFSQMVVMDQMDADNQKRMSYLDACAEDTSYPPRHFCAVCGFEAVYVCMQCGSRYCSLPCKAIHAETRCVKWSG